jgi:hypothetical protein
MKKILWAGAAALALMAPLAAHAAEITVIATVAPNAFGSPSYGAWVSNSITALHDGAATAGVAGTPSFYSAQSSVTAAEVIVTPFASWRGQADPGTVFGAAFANELGNRMLFGLRIDGGGTQFSISQLSFNATSNDVGNLLGFGFAAGTYNYGLEYQGVNAGVDGILWDGDDVFITSGPNTLLVDGLVGRGSGSSFAADICPGCTVAQQQQAINDAAHFDGQPTSFTGTYSLGAATGSGTFSIAVPEPSTWALMIAGFGLVGGMARRRRSATAAQTA